jgi:hypothetical protein
MWAIARDEVETFRGGAVSHRIVAQQHSSCVQQTQHHR